MQFKLYPVLMGEKQSVMVIVRRGNRCDKHDRVLTCLSWYDFKVVTSCECCSITKRHKKQIIKYLCLFPNQIKYCSNLCS